MTNLFFILSKDLNIWMMNLAVSVIGRVQTEVVRDIATEIGRGGETQHIGDGDKRQRLVAQKP